MTQHALDRMTERGIIRVDVVAVIEDPDLTHDSTVPDVRVAQRGDVRVVYNTVTGDVLTVARRDEDQHLEQHMSGWINLDARQAEKLLEDWGFEIHSAKDKSNLWTHPIDEQKRLIPFSVPGRGAKANGKGSFRTAAQVVNVSVHEFIKGPPAGWAEKLAVVRKIEDAHRLIDAPDPLGINKKIVEQATAEIAIETERLTRATAAPAAPAEEPPVSQSYAPLEEKALTALLESARPITARELSESLGVHDVSARDALRRLVREGDAYVVGKRQRAEGGGRAADVFWHQPTYSETPAPEPATAPTPEENPVHAVPQTIDLDAPAPEVAKEKLFTATGTPWPTGGILIQDEDGVFYVARKLVEEGR